VPVPAGRPPPRSGSRPEAAWSKAPTRACSRARTRRSADRRHRPLTHDICKRDRPRAARRLCARPGSAPSWQGADTARDCRLSWSVLAQSHCARPGLPGRRCSGTHSGQPDAAVGCQQPSRVVSHLPGMTVRVDEHPRIVRARTASGSARRAALATTRGSAKPPRFGDVDRIAHHNPPPRITGPPQPPSPCISLHCQSVVSGPARRHRTSAARGYLASASAHLAVPIHPWQPC
jgi:hypothetical protein